MTFGVADEGRHPAGPDPWWVETWVFDVWVPDGSVGAFTWLTLLPNQRRAWYWSALVRPDVRLLHVADLDVPLPAAGLRVRASGLWADHTCETPFEQWTVQNECHAVALDDPADALGRAYGESTPIALDLEWYASALPEPVDAGYRQAGEAHAVIEVAGGPITLEGRAARAHTWGPFALTPNAQVANAPVANLPAEGIRAPVLLEGPTGPLAVERVLTVDGWRTHAVR